MSRGPRSSAASARTGRTRAPRTVSCSALGLNLTCARARPRSACPGACTCARSRRRRCAGSRDGPRPARRRSRRRHSVVARGDPVDRVARSRRSNIAYRVARRERSRAHAIGLYATTPVDSVIWHTSSILPDARAGALAARRAIADKILIGLSSVLCLYYPYTCRNRASAPCGRPLTDVSRLLHDAARSRCQAQVPCRVRR